jgi:hypothetical protein
MKLFVRQIGEMTSAVFAALLITTTWPEQEAVALGLQCLGNQARADHIAISANAAKALLRPVTVKMGSFKQLRAGRYRSRPEDVRDRPEIELAHLDSGIHRRLAAL